MTVLSGMTSALLDRRERTSMQLWWSKLQHGGTDDKHEYSIFEPMSQSDRSTMRTSDRRGISIRFSVGDATLAPPPKAAETVRNVSVNDPHEVAAGAQAGRQRHYAS